ncbi:hypothetical protein AvCA_27060 [Azotobacter vinelandii CA]|uniref:Uncharacterized protein n=2 Tax=Azotobacter vinelandii TaxID=354 RepID=C1DJW1_AZOVD|nr:hypothetical protein Avin_27060 [Azotobacter vinelandii DJ]AGK16568.1 hypothetical protein AvCA_27060 [Azotobacter vinelandii CA]AGK20826.1 hypothetical protein AvCA6_27060 [Azotobacter vinelandii CA6]
MRFYWSLHLSDVCSGSEELRVWIDWCTPWILSAFNNENNYHYFLI